MVIIAGLAAVIVSAAAADAWAQGPEGGRGRGLKKGQGWDVFASVFDADKDGKVTREEMLAKQPAFDRADANHDGTVTETEFDTTPASQRFPKLKSWIARFDADKDKKVSLQEFNDARMKGFEKADKNKDGAIEKGEFTPDLADSGSGK
jgi:Ca2+-binding EF-hand superfamily protein